MRTATAVLRPREEKVPKRMGKMGEIFLGEHVFDTKNDGHFPIFLCDFLCFFWGRSGKTEVFLFLQKSGFAFEVFLTLNYKSETWSRK